jgi:segregation and condensation protein B
MELKAILEAVLFAAQKPLTPGELRALLNAAVQHSEEEAVTAHRKTAEETIEAALAELAAEHARAGRSFHLACVAGGWQFVSLPEYAPWLKALAGERARPPKLSQPALETLTIVAYRQPITRAEMEQIRGVSVDGVLQTLVERGLVEQVGRAEVVGRPMTYGTTKAFLEYFGLASLAELPAADELRRIPVVHPPNLVTTEGATKEAPAEPPEAAAPAETGASTEGREAEANQPQNAETPSAAAEAPGESPMTPAQDPPEPASDPDAASNPPEETRS